MEDCSAALKAVENTMRDFIEEVFIENLGDNWVEQCGVTPERIERWEQRREEERRRIRGRGVEQRILYYADFYDLRVILKKHWKFFEPCFGKWKTMEVYLEKLEDFRNPDAHRRELFAHEVHLVLGITGEVRTAVTNFRSQRKPEDEFFPIFEQVRDSFGNVATHEKPRVQTKRTLYPGDEVWFLATAWDPKGEPCEFDMHRYGVFEIVGWTRSRELKWPVGEQDIARLLVIEIRLRSARSYHVEPGYDDSVSFHYTVLPRS